MNELGIRAALGATSPDIQRLVVGEGVRVAVVGIAMGGAIAAALASTLSHSCSEPERSTS
ncbi:MAG: FtsX-like permease family protein [bacterium]